MQPMSKEMPQEFRITAAGRIVAKMVAGVLIEGEVSGGLCSACVPVPFIVWVHLAGVKKLLVECTHRLCRSRNLSALISAKGKMGTFQPNQHLS